MNFVHIQIPQFTIPSKTLSPSVKMDIHKFFCHQLKAASRQPTGAGCSGPAGKCIQPQDWPVLAIPGTSQLFALAPRRAGNCLRWGCSSKQLVFLEQNGPFYHLTYCSPQGGCGVSLLHTHSSVKPLYPFVPHAAIHSIGFWAP